MKGKQLKAAPSVPGMQVGGAASEYTADGVSKQRMRDLARVSAGVEPGFVPLYERPEFNPLLGRVESSGGQEGRSRDVG